MNKAELIGLAKQQLAIDLGCSPELFDKTENSVVHSTLLEGRRRFSGEPDFLRMATFGKGAVIAADERISGWCQEFLKDREGNRVLEYDVMVQIERELQKYHKHLSGVNEGYLPLPGFNRLKDLQSIPVTVKWYEKDEIPSLYQDKRFKNALLYDVNGLRPDVLVVTADIDNQTVAMAGASMDSELFWQIGIDVMPDHRRMGLAVYLVSALTEEILKRGFIPYYGTWSANIASRNVAAGSGYFPAWVETTAKDSK
ncbi:MAG TPA: GNAT family N-acetyltransferase [Bacillota bacterium]